MSLFSDLSGLWIVYGPAGSGKTTFCMHAAGEKIAQGKRVVYIDAEQSLDAMRFEEIHEKKSLDMGKLLILRPTSFADLHAKILNLRTVLDHCHLIVVDTIGSFYRREVADDLRTTSNNALMQMRVLSELSKHVPVIVTNQVSAVMGTSDVRMVGGDLIGRWGSTNVELKKDPRRMVFKKPQEEIIPFAITSQGIIFR